MVELNHYLSTKVELFLSARNLKDKDTFSKSDPFCIVYLEGQGQRYVEVGRTVKRKNNLNPNWKETVTLDFFFEQRQNLKFVVYDYDEHSPDELGSVFTTLGDIVGKGTSILNLSVGGTLIVRAEEIKLSKDSFLLHFRGIKLDKKDTFGKSDAYIILYKSLNQNQWTEVYRTEVIKNTLDPIWHPFELTEHQLCNCDRSKLLRIECYDWDKVGSHDLIGAHELPFSELIDRGRRFELKNPKKTNSAGTIEITEVILKKNLSFIDYLRCGVQLSLSVAIDFTGSNLDPKNKDSLHHLSEHQWNQYQKAIWEVGGILQAYDNDKFFPVFGFGGIPKGEQKANHCFPLTGDISNPYVQGVEGILTAYYKALNEVSLSGPTLFHHIINQTIGVVQSTAPHTMYHILLILTDGAIMDMPETIASVVRASSLNMSVIIVGVGNAAFDSMEALDCDKGRLQDSHGHRAIRDIVQFVPFRNFGGNPVALAAEVLKEVPSQLTEFMKGIGYIPVVPEQQSIRDIVVEVQPAHKEGHHDEHHEEHH